MATPQERRLLDRAHRFIFPLGWTPNHPSTRLIIKESPPLPFLQPSPTHSPPTLLDFLIVILIISVMVGRGAETVPSGVSSGDSGMGWVGAWVVVVGWGIW
ncbi:hypothetical protein BC829DRAFT_429149, partial [Chytridium lagenaria]